MIGTIEQFDVRLRTIADHQCHFCYQEIRIFDHAAVLFVVDSVVDRQRHHQRQYQHQWLVMQHREDCC